MWFRSWLLTQEPKRALGSRRQPSGAAQRLRPRLEPLEDRFVPSTLTVTNNFDSGPGSLRAEIAAARKNDTIVFAPALLGQTITLTSGELDIKTSLTIQGPGARQLTVSGNGLSRVFEVCKSISVGLSGMTISNGVAAGSSHKSLDLGGGILNMGTLAVSGCNVSNNTAIFGGGIMNLGTMTVTSSAFSSNASGDNGGAIDNGDKASLTVSGCTFDSNSATNSGGAIFNAGGPVEVSNSSFSFNTPDNIFGPYIDGGGNTFS